MDPKFDDARYVLRGRKHYRFPFIIREIEDQRKMESGIKRLTTGKKLNILKPFHALYEETGIFMNCSNKV